jgi:hypothetical protein
MAVYGSSSLAMSGGVIRGNTASGRVSSRGGGVFVYNGSSFTMSGTAVIEENEAKSAGGGVCVSNDGSFIMSGGAIQGNTATDGGGVLVRSSTPYSSFTKTGGTIYDDTDTTHTSGNAENTATSGNGHAVCLSGGTDPKKRNSTAGPTINLYAMYSSRWSYDPSPDGAGDTTANWE